MPTNEETKKKKPRMAVIIPKGPGQVEVHLHGIMPQAVLNALAGVFVGMYRKEERTESIEEYASKIAYEFYQEIVNLDNNIADAVIVEQRVKRGEPEEGDDYGV